MTETTVSPLTVYGMRLSGNCYKVKLLLEQLHLPYEWQELDILAGACRTEEFRQKNPNGKVPLPEWPDGRLLSESNAILLHLAENTAFLPKDAFQRAQVYQWLFFEQYSHEPNIAVARFIVRFLKQREAQADRLSELHKRGYAALQVMEDRLLQQPFLAASYSVADIALFAYTHAAADGGFDLQRYPAIQSWLQRVREQPDFVPMEE